MFAKNSVTMMTAMMTMRTEMSYGLEVLSEYRDARR